MWRPIKNVLLIVSIDLSSVLVPQDRKRGPARCALLTCPCLTSHHGDVSWPTAANILVPRADFPSNLRTIRK